MKNPQKLGLLASLTLLPSVNAIIETSYGTFPDSCPVSCDTVGLDPDNWDHLHRVSDLGSCHQPILFDLNIQHSVNDPESVITIRTCSQGGTKAKKLARADVSTLSVGNDCGAKATRKIKTGYQTGRSSTLAAASSKTLSSAVGDVAAASKQLGAYVTDSTSCGSNIIFAKSGIAVVGLYAGADVKKSSVVDFAHKFEDQARSGRTMMQICDANATLDQTLGLFAGTLDDLAVVQDAIKNWSRGKCQTGSDAMVENHSIELLYSGYDSDNSTTESSSSIDARANCRGIQVKAGDSCASLASRCKISGANFEKYNKKKDLCSTLKPKQYVCCSAGTLPDHRPQPNKDGSCKSHKTKAGDGCWDIADSYGITVKDIEALNKKTWGWAGCSRLQAGQVFCLSKGTPPFPAPIANAACGPQVPGTKPPTDGRDIAKLNPCPLNSCCDVWGFCGVTKEFCTKSPADTGAPGTAKPGTNGCISNCGTDIVNNDSGPSEFRVVGYFEAWNHERKCLTMHVDQIDKKTVTHIHFAFATVNKDWTVNINDVKDEFARFKKMSGVKKILSFGGWAFSTEPDTYKRFRDAAKPENRGKFADNCIKFMKDNGLDGLDFDWEYPGAPDIPDIPPSTKEDAMNYLKFLQLVRDKIGSGKSLSIAIPASYWYLKAFPVDKLQSVVDYFIYMTYDFHGQWDVGNKHSVEGCPDGNCLRSHVNKTETHQALAMITKAGVKSSKLIIGISSYGRSFRMQSPSCGGPNCKYTGTSTKSNAYPGRCTNTGGYISNAEMAEIIDKKKYPIVRKGFDKSSDSDILMFGEGSKVDWVAYMSEATKKSRTSWLKGLKFGGTSDWATDLIKFVGKDDDPNGDEDDKCKADDRTYSTAKTTDPMYMPWYLMDPENAATSTKIYVTIVNMTPHKFKLEHTHSYQMDTFEWGDVPQGKSRQNEIKYRGKSTPVDDNGEAYYEIEGTKKKFEVRCTTHIPDTYPRRVVIDLSSMGLGQREYKVPGQETSVTLVITGSDEYGFIASLSHGKGWMNRIKNVISDRAMKHVFMPGTHDSGMSKLTNAITPLGNEANTQTQGISISNQLSAGARYFDLRVASVHDVTNTSKYKFWVLHVNDETAEVCAGNSGQSLDDVVDDINKFTSDNPGEVIIFRVKYLIGIRSIPSKGPIYWSKDITNDFFSKLKKVNNRCGNLDTSKSISEQTAGYLMGKNGGKGCVLFHLAGNLKDDVPQDSVSDGIYKGSVLGDLWDDWADKGDTEDMAKKEMADWKSIDRPGSNKFLVSQWLVTPDLYTAGTVGLESIAILPTNPALYFAGVNQISPEHFPTVLMVDYIGIVINKHDWDELSAELYTLALGMNLYMVSENCNISKKRSPLLPKPKSSSARIQSDASPEQVPAPREAIFSNGTVLQSPPISLHIGRVPVLKKGTKFSNGTVLVHDMPNPDFAAPAQRF